jgi:serine phosphatase RsbU (regulator of sigma subunit)
LRRINDRLTADLEPGRFVTAFLAFIAGDGRFDWCSAGHGPMVLCHYPRAMHVLQATLAPLGLMGPEDELEPAPAPVILEPGGSLVAMSDGIG